MRRGFTLVELSIVLVIIGLLVGGILAGQSLIRAAELHSVADDISNYSTAMNSFRMKYNAIPGDMNNSTLFWTSAGGNGSDAACDAAITQASKAVCNGNGNGQIDAVGGGAPFSERFYAWKELANAGLISGSYSGHHNGIGQSVGTPGTDVPISKLPNTMYEFDYIPPISGNTEWFDGSYGVNTLIVWGINGTIHPLSPEEAWNIDTKFDDGLPATGSVFAGKSTGTFMPNCTTGPTSTATYNLQDSTLLCNLWVMLR